MHPLSTFAAVVFAQPPSEMHRNALEMENSSLVQLQEEYTAITTALSRKISALEGLASGDPNADSLLDEAQADITDARDVIKKLSNATRSASYSERQKVKTYRVQLDQQRKDLDRLRRKLVLGGRSYASAPKGASRQTKRAYSKNRQNILAGQDVVNDMDQSLLSTQRELERTIGVGADTTNMLHSQREQLIHSRDMVEDTDAILFRARRTLQRMARRAVANKCMTFFIILVELAALGGMVYWKFIKK